MASQKKPVLAQSKPTQSRSPVTKEPTGPPKKWTFSFRFWRQIEYFGMDKSNASWFVSLLEKLAELSKEEIEEFKADRTKKDYWRFHDINWDQKNIPIQRKDLNWLPRDYSENEVDFPLFQFMISKSLGRVVGFMDEIDVFNIVLLDPLHNIQPSASFSYRVDACSPLDCQYTSLLEEVNRAKRAKCLDPTSCPLCLAVSGIPSENHRYAATIILLDDDVAECVNDHLASGKAKDFQDIIIAGLMCEDAGQE